MRTNTIESLNWEPVIAEEQAAIETERKQREEKRVQEEEGRRKERARRNMLVRQGLSGVQGMLADLLKNPKVTHFVQEGFQKSDKSLAILLEAGIPDEQRTVALCIPRSDQLTGLVIEFRETTRGSLTFDWTICQDVFYTLPDVFIAELARLADAEYLLRRVVRALS